MYFSTFNLLNVQKHTNTLIIIGKYFITHINMLIMQKYAINIANYAINKMANIKFNVYISYSFHIL